MPSARSGGLSTWEVATSAEDGQLSGAANGSISDDQAPRASVSAKVDREALINTELVEEKISRENGYQNQTRTAKDDPRGYKKKYAPDERYAEAEPDARVWHVYNDECEHFDSDMINETSSSLDILLIFAGLFSGVVTTFVVQTSQSLSQDPATTTNSILLELVALQRAQAIGTSISSVPTADTSFAPSPSNIWVNGLWFISLTLSLSTALFAVVAKQWLRQYSSFISGSPRERAFVRQFRYDNFRKWNVLIIIGLLPTVLHLALFLFTAGLVVFMFPLNIIIAYVHAVIWGLLCIIYIATNVLPVIFIQCPYRTPLSEIIWRLILPTLKWIEERAERKPDVATSLTVVERRAVRGLGTKQFNEALLWLHENTADTSAKDILAESLGAAHHYTGAISEFRPPNKTDIQWNFHNGLERLFRSMALRFRHGTQTAEDEISLEKLLCALIPEMPRVGLMLEGLEIVLNTPNPNPTMLVTIAAASGCTTNFWCKEVDRPVVLAPQNVLNFIINRYDTDTVCAPQWVWWMLFARTTAHEKFLNEPGKAHFHIFSRIFHSNSSTNTETFSSNIEYYNMADWFTGASLPVGFLYSVLEAPSIETYLHSVAAKEMVGWDNFSRRGFHHLPDSPCLIVPLTVFLSKYFPTLIEGKIYDQEIGLPCSQVEPLCSKILEHIKTRVDTQDDEDDLVREIKPLLEQLDKIVVDAIRIVESDIDQETKNLEKRHAALEVVLEADWTIQMVGGMLKDHPEAKDDLGNLLVRPTVTTDIPPLQVFRPRPCCRSRQT